MTHICALPGRLDLRNRVNPRRRHSGAERDAAVRSREIPVQSGIHRLLIFATTVVQIYPPRPFTPSARSFVGAPPSPPRRSILGTASLPRNPLAQSIHLAKF